MLLDEPTAFLDLPRRIELMRMLRDLSHREQIGMLLSTHDLDLALRFADRLWLISPVGKLIQGFPESLALSGALGSTFTSEHIDWDSESGTFRPHRKPQYSCSIRGEGPAALWTRRCLERLGFEIREDSKEVAFTINLHSSGESIQWKISGLPQFENTYDSLESLIKSVQAKWKRKL